MGTEQPTDVAAELLAYLSRHPNAADTLEGIMNWWLPRQRYETERPRIESTLDQLVAQGLVVRHRLPDGVTVYARSNSASRRDGTQDCH